MLTTDGFTAASLGAHFQQLIGASKPFIHAKEGDLYLLQPIEGVPQATHEQALSELVSLGLLNEYRYIDAKPTPAILVVRA